MGSHEWAVMGLKSQAVSARVTKHFVTYHIIKQCPGSGKFVLMHRLTRAFTVNIHIIWM